MLKVIDEIKREHIFENVEAGSKDEALKMIAENIASEHSLDANGVYEALKAREEQESTGIGHGIAIPHGKMPGIGCVEIFITLLKEEIDFDSLDNEEVRILFTLVADENSSTEYVNVLSQLFFLINQKDIMEKLHEAKSAEDLFSLLQSANALEHDYEVSHQIKYLIELQRAESQVYAFELYESTQSQKHKQVLEEYTKYCESLRLKINKEVLELYDRIKEKYNGRALSKIENYTCSACHIAIPKVTANEVRRQNQIITCFNCGRILFTM